MFSPTVRHRCWNVPVEPVKWIPARSGLDSATWETARPLPVTMLITPGGSPAASSSAHQVVRGQLLGGGRLPDHDVAEQGGGGRQVAGDRGEVERRDRQHESLERAVLEPVPRAGRRPRLLGQQPPGVVHVVPPEVDQLAGRVDLGLVGGLGLAEHGGGVDGGAPRPGQQVGGAQEDGGAVVEGQLAPPWRGPPARPRWPPPRPRRTRCPAGRARAGGCAAGPRRRDRRHPSAARRRSSWSARRCSPASSLIRFSRAARSGCPGRTA